ncbi:MAG: selenium metabolism-associated LysR family transcriptional regulator [Anaerolineae bacterium]
MLSTSYLKSFLEIVKRGSFTEAAKGLRVTQPAVSLQIQRLEAELGTTLFERRESGVVLTPAGEEFYRFAQKVMAERERMLDRLAQLREEVYGELILAASTVPGEYILPRILSGFKARYPAVDITVSISDSAIVLDRLVADECHFGFVGFATEHRGVEFFKIAEDEIVLVVPPDHPFADHPFVALGDLAKEPLVRREIGSGTMESTRCSLRAAGLDLDRCPVAVVLDSAQAVMSAVEAGLGISFVSRLAASKSLELGHLRVVPIEGLSMKRDILCAYRPARMNTRLLEEFLSFVRHWSTSELGGVSGAG